MGMKKLYFLNEEESKRILNLHKEATKKHYLKETLSQTQAEIDRNLVGTATIKDDETFLKDKHDVTIKLYELLKNNGPGEDIDETKLVDAIETIPDLPTLSLVNDEITKVMTSVNKKGIAGLSKIFNNILDYRGGSKWGDAEDVKRLIAKLNELGIDPKETEKLKDNKFVMPSLPSKSSDSNSKIIPPKKEEKVVPSIPPKKEVKVVPCPVGKGTTPEIKAFQDWLDDNNKGWLPKYPKGLNSEVNKGYGRCGPNTRKAWANVTLQNAYVKGVTPDAVTKEVTPTGTEAKTSVGGTSLSLNTTPPGSVAKTPPGSVAKTPTTPVAETPPVKIITNDLLNK